MPHSHCCAPHRRGVDLALALALALDQVAFPLARHHAIFDFRRAHLSTDHLGNLAASVPTARTRPARCLALAQTDNRPCRWGNTPKIKCRRLQKLPGHLLGQLGTPEYFSHDVIMGHRSPMADLNVFLRPKAVNPGRRLPTQSGHLLLLVFGRSPERVARNEMVGRFYQSMKFRLAVETDFISHAIA